MPVPTNGSPRWWRRIPVLDKGLRRLRRSDEIQALQFHLARLRGVDAESFLVWTAPGHFYSPVPNIKEIKQRADRIFGRPERLEGVDLNARGQLTTLEALAPLANDVAFDDEPRGDARFALDNPSYNRGDAVITQAFLRHLRPAHYLEVGSGWTTALALDTNERWLGGRMRITCIEPYPEDLHALLRPGDDVEVMVTPVQDVPLERFGGLAPGDVLFIDCSHVVKTGSDAHYLITRVLPVVPPGVYIHIHDIFWPFEYPKEWVYEGRAWNEAYLLHAFLSFNPEFEIVLFNDWLMHERHDVIQRLVPAMAPAAGAAIWLRRRERPAAKPDAR